MRVFLDGHRWFTAGLALATMGWLGFEFVRDFDWTSTPGQDYRLYMDATRSWLGGGAFYLSRQLVGSYVVSFGDVLYPPPALILFAPFTVLPAFLWWIIPLGVTAHGIWRLHPAPWSWPLLAYCVGFFQTPALVRAGNPVMWIVAALAIGAGRWPSVFVLLKPTLAPLALIGARDRRWWLALGALLAISALFGGAMWLDYARVLMNAHDPRRGLFYSILDVPFVLLPVFATCARTSRAARSRQLWIRT